MSGCDVYSQPERRPVPGHMFSLSVEDGELRVDVTCDGTGECHENPDGCWVESWFENVTPDELLHGTVDLGTFAVLSDCTDEPTFAIDAARVKGDDDCHNEERS